MARPLRIAFPGALYHVVSRGNEGQAIVRDDADRRKRLDWLRRTVETYGWRLHAFVLMNNHDHLFVETPEANLSANAEARRNNLSVVVGLQRRHQKNYLEGVQRIHDGEIGTIHLLRTYFNMPSGGRSGWLKPEGMSKMEYQVRHWGVFCWLCGDHVVEQATHEIDVANWIMDAHPVQANGMGGRQVRVGPGNGDIWDHHFIEFVYADDVRFYCQARQQLGTWSHVSDNIHGTKGEMTIGTGAWGLGKMGPREMRSTRLRVVNPYQQEHQDLAMNILGEAPYRMEGDYGATSSMTAVMGRMATYSGKVVTWDEATAATQRLGPARYALDAQPPVLPLRRYSRLPFT